MHDTGILQTSKFSNLLQFFSASAYLLSKLLSVFDELQLYVFVTVPRLHQLRHENGMTRQKMQMLREEMRLRRKRRQSRRQACGPYQKRVAGMDEDSQPGLSLSSDNSLESADRSIDVSNASLIGE